MPALAAGSAVLSSGISSHGNLAAEHRKCLRMGPFEAGFQLITETSGAENDDFHLSVAVSRNLRDAAANASVPRVGETGQMAKRASFA
jgi:hypothetical protein